jgi:hypothetical protein
MNDVTHKALDLITSIFTILQQHPPNLTIDALHESGKQLSESIRSNHTQRELRIVHPHIGRARRVRVSVCAPARWPRLGATPAAMVPSTSQPIVPPYPRRCVCLTTVIGGCRDARQHGGAGSELTARPRLPARDWLFRRSPRGHTRLTPVHPWRDAEKPAGYRPHVTHPRTLQISRSYLTHAT